MKTRLGVRCRAGDLEGCEDESFLIKDRVEMRDEALYHHEPGLRWGQPIGGSSQRWSILSMSINPDRVLISVNISPKTNSIGLQLLYRLNSLKYKTDRWMDM